MNIKWWSSDIGIYDSSLKMVVRGCDFFFVVKRCCFGLDLEEVWFGGGEGYV